MKKRLLSPMLALALCLGSALPALAVGDTGKAGGYRQTISTSYGNAWVIKEDNSLWGWGREQDTVPTKIMDNVATVSAGGIFDIVMAVKTDGTLWSWGFGVGENTTGELGDGTLEGRDSPQKIMDNVATVSAGSNHVLAVKTDGTLWAWGSNQYGQLGNGGVGNMTVEVGGATIVDGVFTPITATIQTVPVKIMDDVAAVSAGYRYSLAIKTDGTLWAWGSNYYGQLGDGTKEQRLTPVKIMDGVAAVSAGDDHSLAIKTDGTLWAWGCNCRGQLGNGGVGNEERTSHGISMDGQTHYMPVQTVPAKLMDSVAAVSAGNKHSFAVKTDGTLWAWGSNYSSELGDGTEERRLTPVKIMDGAVAVSSGGSDSFPTNIAVKTDGTLWGWGSRDSRILGEEEPWVFTYPTPVRLMDKVKLPTAFTPTPSAPTTPSTPTTNAVLSPQKLAVNGENIDCEKYNIGGSNYFKLRDLAQVLNGTGSQFGVGYDAATSTVTITTGEDYESTGTELMAGGDKSSTAQPSAQSILIDGVKHDELTAYNIGGSNFFQLRELGNVLGFEVGYDQDTNTAIVRSR